MRGLGERELREPGERHFTTGNPTFFDNYGITPNCNTKRTDLFDQITILSKFPKNRSKIGTIISKSPCFLGHFFQ